MDISGLTTINGYIYMTLFGTKGKSELIDITGYVNIAFLFFALENICGYFYKKINNSAGEAQLLLQASIMQHLIS